jgi:DNA-binding GntR family transcriptional regulator
MAQIVLPARPYRPLSADAYEALREAILTGRLAPGERLVEAEVARQMGVSRAPIREAIRKLERDGLVEYIPRRGTVVVKLSPEEVRDAYYLRAHLEAYAIRRAAVRITDEDLAALEDLIARMRECATHEDLHGLIAADVAFHARICQASGSARLYRLWDSLNPHCWTLLTSLKVAGYTLLQIAERHQPVLAALKARDPDRAEAEIRRHITELADNVLAHLDAPA